MGISFNDNKALRIFPFHSYLLLNLNEYWSTYYWWQTFPFIYHKRDLYRKDFPIVRRRINGTVVLIWGHLEKDFIVNLGISSIILPEDYSDMDLRC